jgi:hypothetical protein
VCPKARSDKAGFEGLREPTSRVFVPDGSGTFPAEQLGG